MLHYLSRKRKEFEKAVQQSEHDAEKRRTVVKEHMTVCKKNLEKKMLTIEDLSSSASGKHSCEKKQLNVQIGSLFTRWCSESRGASKQIGDA